MLTYAGKVDTDRRQLLGPSPSVEHLRWAASQGAFRTGDEGPASLLRRLRESAPSDPLEHAVGALLHLMGLDVANYGDEALGRSDDPIS